jgi:3-oxoacyl-[acyl-carrier protein] reductase
MTSNTVLITGASRGIGRATAELFATRGWQVLINYYHSEAEALALQDKLRQQGCSVETFRANVTDRSQVEAMVDACSSIFGSIDLLINNAGIANSILFQEITDSEWDRMIDVNLKSVYLCSQAVLHQMIPKKNGRIINIASIWGITGASCEVHYSAAKAGVIGLTKALAKELGPSNIQVNCIAPGIIDTEMLTGLNREELADLQSQTPLGRLGTPAEIAACAWFLASKEAGFITGQVISPNGGFVI